MPLVQSNSTVWTFQDCVEHLLDSHELDTREGLNERRARASILHAYRELPNRHSWSYYYRQRLLQTVATQSSSTVAYDHTGGAYERMLTLASGTWPSWAAYGRVIIDSIHYEVDTRESDTQLTLREDSNPGADVDSGTSYTLYRSAFPLPANFASLCRIWDVEEERPLDLVDPVQHHTALQAYYDTPSVPWEAMIRSTGEHYGGLHLHFGPPPSTARTYDLLYRVNPRPLVIDEYSVGTVTVSSGSATVTGSGTTFPTNCAGSIIRFSSNGNVPTGVIGGHAGDNPFVLQGVIKTRGSATSLTLEENASVAIAAGSGYVISDPIDIESGSMLTAFLRMAEAEFCLKAGRKDAQLKTALANQAILEAMAADTRYDNLGNRPGMRDPFTRTSVTSE
jgi:hypothetical protein